MKVENCFKESEIGILEVSKKHLLQREYCEPIKNSLTSDAHYSTIQTELQLAQVSAAMTIEDMSRVRMLERTKSLLITKLER